MSIAIGTTHPPYWTAARMHTSACHTISASAPPACAGRPAFFCTASSPRQKQTYRARSSTAFAAVSAVVTAGVNTALCKIVVLRISVAKKYAARITVMAKQPPSQRFSCRSVRKPNSSSTVPMAGRM